eukprot:TRINITY_DN3289_c0_g1_i1.p1 TRINITY_DN3289_c0_g1~~TRINITY_DN3289_c0_g1_i1.p1  ORF type:complete len:373 (-),score=53.59 TRINITY_DN3289_c0_g1_i1:640-1758(-)
MTGLSTGDVSPTPTRAPFALVLDVDGVLMRNGNIIDGVKETLDRLTDQRLIQDGEATPQYTPWICPTLFVTNGGGMTEKEKAGSVSKTLGVKINPADVILSHTPLRKVTALKEQHILLVARNPVSAREVATAYGWKSYTTFPEYASRHKAMFPSKYDQHDSLILEPELPHEEETPFDAIVVLNTPFDWGESIQVFTDVLRSSNGIAGKKFLLPDGPEHKQHVKLYVGNPDFVYGGMFDVPRFTTGAWLTCLATLYEKMTGGRVLEYEAFGKPYPSTYAYAMDRIGSDIDRSRVFAIGDNPLSDIVGANRHGMSSILVRTGVYHGDKNLESAAATAATAVTVCGGGICSSETTPTVITEDFVEAIDYVFEATC